MTEICEREHAASSDIQTRSGAHVARLLATLAVLAAFAEEAPLAAVCSKLPNNLREKRLIVCDTSVTCCCRISDINDL